jgi:hypothetical protein
MSKIGDFLVSIGVMTKDQAETVLIRQRQGDTRIFGEIAIEMGFINDESIKRYIDHKESDRLTVAQTA